MALTELEYQMMNAVAHDDYNLSNGTTPETYIQVDTYYIAADLARQLKVNEQVIGGVTTSLQAKGFIVLEIFELDDEDDAISFTESGFKAWKEEFEKRS